MQNYFLYGKIKFQKTIDQNSSFFGRYFILIYNKYRHYPVITVYYYIFLSSLSII